MIKVRFAPSPTGIPHIGNTRTALFNFLFAKHNKGKFILRIEDTDQKRIVKGAEKAILDIFEWLGIDFDGEVLHQSERLDIYKKYAHELLEKNIANEKEGAIWVKVPDNKTFEWTDKVGNKKIKIEGKDVEDFVILKSDSFPTYHLASVIDDHLMEITDVIRGEEWISSTPKHIFLYESFGWEKPNFAHLPVILGPDRSKLSKRHGAASVLDYRDKGYLKEALLNFMALLGWNPGGDKEQMDMDEMIRLFDIKDVNTANPVFDIKKLEWINGLWIRTLQKDELKNRLSEFYQKEKQVLETLSGGKSDLIVEAASTRMKTLADFKTLIDTNKDREKTKEEKELSKKLLDYLNNNLKENWEGELLLSSIRNFSKENKVSFKTIYFLLSGKESGIGILELNNIYGKDFLLENLKS